VYRIPLLLASLAALAAPLAASAGITKADIALVEDTDGKITESAFLMDQYLRAAACRFYEDHPDQYDAIFVFSIVPLDFFGNTQQGWPVKQDEKGIGRMLYNQTASFCAKKGRLSQAVKMGAIDTMPDNPDDLYKGIPMYTLSGIELMGHEFGHHWMAAVTFAHEDGIKHCLLRGHEPTGEPKPGDCDGYEETEYNQHWAYYFNSGGVMYGNNIIDLGGGQFRIWNEAFKYGPLDQYLMGIRFPEEVGPLFIADPGDGSVSSPSIAAPKNKEQTFSGTRIDFTVDDVIRSVGPREPMPDACHWKGAILAVHAKNKLPSAKQLDKLVAYGNRWEEWYAFATDNRGSFDMTLAGSGTGTADCPGTAVDPPEPLPDRPADEPPEAIPDASQPVEVWDPGAGEDAQQPPADPGAAQDVAAPEPGADPGAEAAASDVPAADRPGATELPATCKPGDFACSGARAMKCSATGHGWVLYQDCENDGKVCAEGMCIKYVAPGGNGGGASSGGCGAGAGAAAPAAPVLLAFALIALRRRPDRPSWSIPRCRPARTARGPERHPSRCVPHAPDPGKPQGHRSEGGAGRGARGAGHPPCAAALRPPSAPRHGATRSS